MIKTVNVNGRAVEWEDQMSIQRLLEKLEFSHRIFIVKMNSKIIQKKMYSTQIVPENARLTVLPLVAGG